MDDQKVARNISVVVIVCGIAVIFGWIFDVSLLKTLLPGLVSMKFIAAISFVLSGLILYLSSDQIIKKNWAQILSLSLSTMLFLLMLMLLIGSLTGSQTGLENLFVQEQQDAVKTVSPGRPSVGTILNFVLIGFLGLLGALKLSKIRKQRNFFGIIIALIGVIALLGYLLNEPALYYSIEKWSTAMAIHTSFLFVLLGAGFYMQGRKYYGEDIEKSQSTIQTKIIMSFLVLVFFVGIFGYLSLSYLNKSKYSFENELPKNIAAIEKTSHLNGLAQFIRYYDEVLTQSARNYAFTQDARWEQRYRSVEPELDKAIKEAISQGDEKDKEYFLKVDAANLALVKMEYDAIENVNNGRPQDAVKILESEEYKAQKKIYEQELKEYVARKGANYNEVILTSTNSLESAIGETNKILETSRKLILVYVVGALSLAILLGVIVTRKISNQIKKLSDMAEEIGRGNLDVRADINTKDEVGILAATINKMADELKRSKKKIEEHSIELENEVRVKTSELNSKVEELEKSKIATINIMEDIESANRELLVAQDQLKQNVAELKKLDFQKDQFISIAAHELKTPLTSIKGFSDLLRKKEVAGNEPLREKYLGIIYSDTKRLATMITNILELSRMDLGTMKLALQEIDVKDLFAEVRDQMDIIIKNKGLESQYSIGEGLPKVWIDKDKMIQVISNIINNAVHYTEKGNIAVSAKKQDNFVLFSIADTGIGIPKEHWGKIFTRFYQVDNPLTRKIGGTGLGLSISKGFVEAMGGKIWFDSEVGKGTTFYFTLPLKRIATEDVQIVQK